MPPGPLRMVDSLAGRLPGSCRPAPFFFFFQPGDNFVELFERALLGRLRRLVGMQFGQLDGCRIHVGGDVQQRIDFRSVLRPGRAGRENSPRAAPGENRGSDAAAWFDPFVQCLWWTDCVGLLCQVGAAFDGQPFGHVADVFLPSAEVDNLPAQGRGQRRSRRRGRRSAVVVV